MLTANYSSLQLNTALNTQFTRNSGNCESRPVFCIPRFSISTTLSTRVSNADVKASNVMNHAMLGTDHKFVNSKI